MHDSTDLWLVFNRNPVGLTSRDMCQFIVFGVLDNTGEHSPS